MANVGCDPKNDHEEYEIQKVAAIWFWYSCNIALYILSKIQSTKKNLIRARARPISVINAAKMYTRK